MATDLTPTDVAGILDQIYRASVGGLPHRFHLRSDQLRAFAGRQRSLRSEFFDQTAVDLEDIYSILMSYPRLGRGGVLGFASCRLADSWPAATDDNLRELLRSNVGADWGQSVRRRLRLLYELSQGDSTSARPLLISEQQLCELGEQPTFGETWWLELMGWMAKASVNDRLIFFYQGAKGDRVFAVTREDHVSKWYHPTPADWAAALRRYSLDEID